MTRRLIAANQMRSVKTDEPEVEIRGPHGWINWRAQLAGQPRRQTKHPDNILIRPIWQEFALYTDTALRGPWLMIGPYEFIEIDHIPRPTIGHANKVIVLRVWDHLEDHPPGPMEQKTNIEAFVGGDIADELTALLGLTLERRMRSGGMVRQGLPETQQPLGIPDEHQHRAPTLEPPYRGPLLPGIAEDVALTDASELLKSYPALQASDAVALTRAARQYVDGLWIADADPRLSWIKLVGALEVAANQYDRGRSESAVERLSRHQPELSTLLEEDPHLLAAVAKETSHLFRSAAKLRAFVTAFDPGPPSTRPEPTIFQFDWAELLKALDIIYGHRSRDLHSGIAFPPALCEAPIMADNDVPAERFPARAAASLGGEWQEKDLPMHLHVFAHLVGGCLRKWWHSLTLRADESVN